MSFSDPSPVVIGHRGAAGLVAENTLPSFRRAYACGVNAVELDVYTVAGELVVFHDETLDRTTDGTGTLLGQSLDSLRRLDAGGGWPVPFLTEVVAELPTGVGLNVELKGPETAAPAAAFIARRPDVDWLVSSFDHRQLADFRRLDRRTRVAPLFNRWREDAWKVAAELDAWAVNLSRRAATTERLQRAGELGLRVFVYTINDLESARALIANGASGVFTDLPDRIAARTLT
ncbi:MAG: glycerophosphodiester phosphodiesterase family protein [Pseudomonadales bacterium]